LSADARREGGHEDDCCEFHTFPLPMIGHRMFVSAGRSRTNASACTTFR
jgi:hypothetical protein